MSLSTQVRGDRRRIVALGAAGLLALAASTTAMAQSAAPPSMAPVVDGASVGLITKTEVNPFFVTMRNAAQAKADELGVPFQACAGASDSDTPGQVTCIENQIAAGVTTILLTPGDPLALAPTVTAARGQGVVVIALDTQMNPTNVANATLATDNFQAGLFIGEWAKGTLGAEAANAVIGLLDVSDGKQITTEVQRNQGFMQGFGIADIGDPTKLYDEVDPRIAGYGATDGNQELGRTAMENLLAKNPAINLVYTINEPAAAGAYEAIQAAGLDHPVLIVSVDGGCPGVQNVKDGKIGATSMQFPLRMAQQGVIAAATGVLPAPSEGLEFTNTGVVLITDQPVEGVESQDTTWGLENCWG
ncbi:MAG: substrate-binding domain-containing protein [Chloroflexi bacterium]|nr:substrate-binding domain-containing protein [Chloroflexota bacterium]